MSGITATEVASEMAEERLNEQCRKEADRLLHLYLNGGEPGPEAIRQRIAALLKTERLSNSILYGTARGMFRLEKKP